MATIRGPRIVTSGLVFCVNAADKKSYSGSGTSWIDLSSNRAVGTLTGTGGPTFNSGNGGYFSTGAFDSARYFSWGTGLSQVNFTSSNFTISMMLRLNAANFGVTRQIGMLGYGRIFTSGYYMTLNVEAVNRVSFFTNSVGSNRQETRSSDFSVYSGKWTLLTVTRSGSSVRIYANTTDITDIAGSHVDPVSNTAYPLVLATETSGGTPNFNADGDFASLIFYNKALSSTEIAQNFNAQRGRFGI